MRVKNLRLSRRYLRRVGLDLSMEIIWNKKDGIISMMRGIKEDEKYIMLFGVELLILLKLFFLWLFGLYFALLNHGRLLR